MRNWSMCARLTLWYSAVLLAGLALFGVSIWVVVNHRLMATIDESLAAQAEWCHDGFAEPSTSHRTPSICWKSFLNM